MWIAHRLLLIGMIFCLKFRRNVRVPRYCFKLSLPSHVTLFGDRDYMLARRQLNGGWCVVHIRPSSEFSVSFDFEKTEFVGFS